MRVALLTNILTPYRLPVYRALARRTGEHWRVLVNARSEFDRDWQVDAADLDVELVRGASFVRGFAFGGAHARQRVTTHLPFGLWPSLLRFRPDVVVSAELGARTGLAWLYCALLRVPLVIWSYHSRASATAPGPLRALRRFLLARAACVVGMGAQARSVLRGLGVADARIVDAPNAHDADGIAAALQTAKPDDVRAELRTRGAREHVALVAGRLVEGKGIDALLRGWDALPAELRASWSLVFLGDGPLRDRIRHAADARERGELLHCAAVAPERVVDFYRASDLLVFASLGDPWGLVVNEALACGLPVLCSSRAGCADDLIVVGENGWVADPLAPRAWLDALVGALGADHARMADAARRTATRFGPERMAAGIGRAVERARSTR